MARTEERRRPATTPAGGATPALIRWGAVVGGGIIGLSLLVLLTALWLALAFGTGVQAVEANFDWFMTISAIVAMFVGGMLAGWLAGVPGFAPGMFNGLTVWGVILTVSLLVGVPGMLQTAGIPADVDVGAVGGDAIWAGFVALLIGALAAAIGGGIGGMTTRPAFVYAAPEPADRRERRVEADGGRRRDADESRGTDESRAAPEPAEAEDRPSRAGQGGRHRAPEEAHANGGTERR